MLANVHEVASEQVALAIQHPHFIAPVLRNAHTKAAIRHDEGPFYQTTFLMKLDRQVSGQRARCKCELPFQVRCCEQRNNIKSKKNKG